MTIDAITATVFKTELKELLTNETAVSLLMIHAICLLAQEVLDGEKFYTCMNFD